MFAKIRNWIEARKITKLSTWTPCDFECYESNGCHSCSVWIERYDPEYGTIGTWRDPRDPVNPEHSFIKNTYADEGEYIASRESNHEMIDYDIIDEMEDEIDIYINYHEYLAANEERANNNPKAEDTLYSVSWKQYPLFPNTPAWA